MKNIRPKNNTDVIAVARPMIRAIDKVDVSPKRITQMARRTERALGIQFLHWRDV
jgi:hypothetical protein